MDKKIYNLILENIHEGVYFVDRDRKISFWNYGAERISGFSADEVIGSYCFDNILNHVDAAGRRLCLSGCTLHATITDGIIRENSIYLHNKAGYRVPIQIKTIPCIENGKIVGAAEVFHELTDRYEMLKEIEQLKSVAMIDHLTQLPNRRYLDTFLESKLLEHRALGIKFAVLFFDIDNFSQFNTTYGHAIGDELLKVVSTTCMNILRKTDVIARWGGEEFMAVATGLEADGLSELAEKMRVLIESSRYRHGKQYLNVTVSIGATMVRYDDTIKTLTERADALLYESKKNGKNMVTIG